MVSEKIKRDSKRLYHFIEFLAFKIKIPITLCNRDFKQSTYFKVSQYSIFYSPTLGFVNLISSSDLMMNWYSELNLVKTPLTVPEPSGTILLE